MGEGSTSPLSLRLLSQRLIEGTEIPKIPATSLRGIPRSTASNTLSLRSFEYAFMPGSFHEDQPSRNLLSEVRDLIEEGKDFLEAARDYLDREATEDR